MAADESVGPSWSGTSHLPAMLLLTRAQLQVVVVDIDNGTLTIPSSEQLPAVPQPQAQELRTKLRSYVYPELADAGRVFPRFQFTNPDGTPSRCGRRHCGAGQRGEEVEK